MFSSWQWIYGGYLGRQERSELSIFPSHQQFAICNCRGGILVLNSPRWILPKNLCCCLLTIGDFWACCYYWLGENPFKWEVCALCHVFVTRTSELAVVALVATFLINVNWELAHGFLHLLCPCKEDIFAGATQNSTGGCVWLQGRKFGLR